MRTGVVVVTYRTGPVLNGLLRSLRTYEPDAPVVVVDDASPGGPPATHGVELIVTSERRGYGTSCNRGVAALREHDVDLVAFLNPDVRLEGPSLSELAVTFAERTELGIATGPVCGPQGERLPSAWGRTSIRRALAFAADGEARRLRSAAGAVFGPRVRSGVADAYDPGHRIDGHVRGGTMIARLACLDAIGGFDEEFFLYWEDADLCHRARDAGWEVRLLSCTPFLQAETESSGIPDDERWSWFVEGATRFGRKHLVPGQARQLEAALSLGRRLAKLRERG